MEHYQLPAFCQEHHAFRGSSAAEQMISMKLIVDLFFTTPEVESVILRHEDDPRGGMDELNATFAPVCCFLGTDLVREVCKEAKMVVKWGPRLSAPSYDTQADTLEAP
jgi:hypothetical protein